MRWPWQPRPGMVRVRNRDLIRLQRDALRAAEFEAEIAREERDAALLTADTRARQLLEERCRAQRADIDPGLRGYVLAALPLRQDGRLHEAAFLALVEQRVMFERELESVLEDGRGEAR